ESRHSHRLCEIQRSSRALSFARRHALVKNSACVGIALCRAHSPPAMRWNSAYWLDDFCDRRIDFMGPRGTPDISPSMRSCISTKHAPGRRRLAHLAALIRGGKVVMILLSRCSREPPKSDDLSGRFADR